MRAAATKLSMCLSKIKLDSEKLKHTIFAQQNGFGPTLFHKMLSLVRGTVQPNKFDLTATKNAINRI
jgi:hypothetical protein